MAQENDPKKMAELAQQAVGGMSPEAQKGFTNQEGKANAAGQEQGGKTNDPQKLAQDAKRIEEYEREMKEKAQKQKAQTMEELTKRFKEDGDFKKVLQNIGPIKDAGKEPIKPGKTATKAPIDKNKEPGGGRGGE